MHTATYTTRCGAPIQFLAHNAHSSQASLSSQPYSPPRSSSPSQTRSPAVSIPSRITRPHSELLVNAGKLDVGRNRAGQLLCPLLHRWQKPLVSLYPSRPSHRTDPAYLETWRAWHLIQCQPVQIAIHFPLCVACAVNGLCSLLALACNTSGHSLSHSIAATQPLVSPLSASWLAHTVYSFLPAADPYQTFTNTPGRPLRTG